jgi:hypothetical protein
MSNFGEIQSRINTDYLNRTDLSAATQRAIFAAIRHYESQRFNFNETATALATSAGQSFVTFPSNLITLDYLQITDVSCDVALIYRDYDWIKRANVTRTQSIPTHYTIYQNRIELFAIPDSAYSLPVAYIKRFPQLSADADSNPWTSGEAEDVIVYHATKLMWANVLRNTDEALKYAELERASKSELMRYREQMPHLVIRASSF